MSASSHYIEYARLWKEFLVLWDEGKINTPEADKLCDKMNEPWDNMSEEEKDRFRHCAFED